MANMIGYNTTVPPYSTAGQPTRYDPAYGGIPTLPRYTTDTTSMIGTDVPAQMAANLPGYGTMMGTDVNNIQANLSGQLPEDVINLMQRQAAERGISTGSPGSPNANAAYLAALGLTSLQRQELGHSQLTEAMQRTPIQQMQTGTQTRDLSAEQAVYSSAPSPAAAASAALANAQAGMRAGGSLVSPKSGTSQMGYTQPSYLDQGYDFQNAWANSPQMQSAIAATQAEEERARLWQSANLSPYNSYEQPQSIGDYYAQTMDPWGYYFSTGDESMFGGNQPTGQGSMYVSPQEEWYTDASDPSYYDPETGAEWEWE